MNLYHDLLPTDLRDLFTFSSDIRLTNFKLNSVYKKLMHIPRFNTTTYGNKSIKYHCTEL